MAAARVVIPYSPRRAFLPLHNRSQRWAVVVAHRRAGKTVACVNELIKAAICHQGGDGRFAYVAPFYRQAKSVAWDYLKRYSAPIPGIKVNESELRIDYPNGSRVQLYGADNADSLRGLFFDGIVADEYGDWKPTVWGYVIRPALADRGGWAIIIGTPKGRNQFYEIYQYAERSPDWLCMTIRADVSGLLPATELEALRAELTEDAWRQEMLCDFDAAIPGAIYGRELFQAEQEGRITAVEYERSRPVHTAWDLGWSDDTAIWFYQVVAGEVRVIDYYEANGQPVSHYAEVIHGKSYKYGKHWLPHDARPATLAANGRSILQQLYALNVKGSIAPELSQQDGIQAVRMMLPKVWIDRERCSAGLNALKQYQREYDEDKKCFRDKPRHDWTSHAADAFRYLALAWKEEAAPPKPKMAEFKIAPTFNELVEEARRKRLSEE